MILIVGRRKEYNQSIRTGSGWVCFIGNEKMNLSPEERNKICEEEKARIESEQKREITDGNRNPNDWQKRIIGVLLVGGLVLWIVNDQFMALAGAWIWLCLLFPLLSGKG
tara:strand:+ start:149 stop:478 length:330 start_codon:yes stop_codon:yes gene_type:complete